MVPTYPRHQAAQRLGKVVLVRMWQTGATILSRHLHFSLVVAGTAVGVCDTSGDVVVCGNAMVGDVDVAIESSRVVGESNDGSAVGVIVDLEGWGVGDRLGCRVEIAVGACDVGTCRGVGTNAVGMDVGDDVLIRTKMMESADGTRSSQLRNI